MAEIRLTVGGIAVTTERGTTTVSYDEHDYNVCLVDLSFQKKMYQPTEIKAKLDFEMNSSWVAVSRTTIEKAFKLHNAILEVGESVTDKSGKTTWTAEETIGNDYYVHDVRVHYQSDWMYVYLTIYSLDKLLTLNKGCNTYVGKTLSSVLTSVLTNYKVPYNKEKSLSFDKSGMQVLQIDTNQKDSNGNEVMKEHMFPYLIQYNESFYDLLKRTTNRWGEFLYWENGTLTIGYDDSTTKELDQSLCSDIYYFDLEDEVNLDIPSAGSYDYAAAYDENVGNTPIKKDPYKVYGKLGKWNGQFDKYAFSVASRFFQNEDSLPSWLVGLLVDDLWDLMAESSYVSQDNNDFNDVFFKEESDDETGNTDSPSDDQYNSNRDELNLYTEFDSKYHKDTSYYSEILGHEIAAGKNAIRIKCDTTWPKLKLGDVIKVNDEQFIVVEVIAKAPKEFRIKDNTKIVVCPGQTITFEVVATAKISDGDNKKFYPAILPTGHVRQSGPQVATIVDMDDPLKANRVRVVYDWQGDSASSDESEYSPWLLYAAGSHGSPRGGRHLNGTKVLVGFVNDNIERPYVLGNIQEADTFVELKDVSLETPGKRKFQMWDHVGGVQKFVSGLVAPAVSTVSDFCPAVDYFSLGDGGLQLAGGFCITDRLGLYNISGSTDEREVKIDSAWGEVKISAFTGITISAPNGDVKIKGKNVEIAAGNNLKLSSGNNVGYHMAWGKGDDPSLSSVLSDVCCKLIEKIGEKVQLIDLSFLRNTAEVIFRPQEGCMTLKSNRYMKIETGANSCEYPAAAYSKDKRQKVVDEEAKSTILSSIGSSSSIIPGSSVLNLSMLRSLISIIHKLPGLATVWLDGYSKKYDYLVKQRELCDQAIERLKYYSSTVDWETTDVCKTYDDLKADIWNTDDTDDWTEDKLDFKDNVKVDGDDVLSNVSLTCRNRLRGKFLCFETGKQARQKELCQNIINKRTKWRDKLLERVNKLRWAIREMRPIEWSEEDLSKQLSDWIGNFLPYPDDFISNLEDALSKDNCKDVAVFYPNESMKDLANKIADNGDVTKGWKKYMTRMIVVKFLKSLGFEDDMRRKIMVDDQEVTIDEPDFSDVSNNGDTSLVNDSYWRKYVQSLSGVPAIQKAESSFLSSVADSATDALKGTVSVDDILKFKENFSWSEGKKGGVLFGYNGTTYELKGQQITPIETIEPSFKYISETSGDIDKWDKKRLVKFMDKLRAELIDI